MNKFIFCILYCLILFTISSCSFHRHVASKKAKHIEKDSSITAVSDTASKINSKKPNTDTATIVNTSDLNSNNHLIDLLTPVWDRKYNYTTFSGKAKIHYEGHEEKEEFTANFRIKKDSIIWVAITAMGGMVQAARVAITPDSFFMINYIQKEVLCLSIKESQRILPVKVDFNLLQNLIIGKPLSIGKVLHADSTNSTWSFDIANTEYLQNISYNKIDSTLITEQIKSVFNNGFSAILEFGDYITENNIKVATKRTLNLNNKNEIYSLDIKFQNFNFDLPLDFPFNIPKNYEKK